MEIRKNLKEKCRKLTPQRLFARKSGPKVIANSIPKSGTNLLLTCLHQFPMLRPSHRHSAIKNYRHIGYKEVFNTVTKTKKGQYSSGHIPYNDVNKNMLMGNNIRAILMIRDPRDVTISHMHWVTEKHPDHRLRPHYEKLDNKNEKILASLNGFSGKYTKDGKPFEGVKKWLEMFIPWTNESINYTVKFEELIGPKGGGSKELQKKVISDIGKHINVELSEEDIVKISNKTYSPRSSTFRKGKIGDWKNHLDSELKNEFKKSIGNWLIELGYEKNNDW